MWLGFRNWVVFCVRSDLPERSIARVGGINCARNHPKIAAITAMQIGLVTVENSMPSRAKLKPTL